MKKIKVSKNTMLEAENMQKLKKEILSLDKAKEVSEMNSEEISESAFDMNQIKKDILPDE